MHAGVWKLPASVGGRLLDGDVAQRGGLADTLALDLPSGALVGGDAICVRKEVGRDSLEDLLLRVQLCVRLAGEALDKHAVARHAALGRGEDLHLLWRARAHHHRLGLDALHLARLQVGAADDHAVLHLVKRDVVCQAAENGAVLALAEVDLLKVQLGGLRIVQALCRHNAADAKVDAADVHGTLSRSSSRLLAALALCLGVAALGCVALCRSSSSGIGSRLLLVGSRGGLLLLGGSRGGGSGSGGCSSGSGSGGSGGSGSGGGGSARALLRQVIDNLAVGTLGRCQLLLGLFHLGGEGQVLGLHAADLLLLGGRAQEVDLGAQASDQALGHGSPLLKCGNDRGTDRV
eukprot:m.49212 g.49212  ORF g.49212 m.49212 type:complete len:348 (+) comp12800_c0_seq1:134-1177(+)